MCLYPRLMKNKKFTSNKKNGGVKPEIKDTRVLVVPIGCGKCMECKKQKSTEWQVRLHEEIRESKNGKFVTMTFTDEALVKLQSELKTYRGYELENQTATLAVRRFLERWRKKNKISVRHWLVTELGQKDSERIHIHGILWTDEDKEEIEEKWKYGNVWIGEYVNNKTINYIVKYINKVDAKHKEYKSKVLTSKGIGSGYLRRIDSENNKYNGVNTDETYRTREGAKLALPIYYRNKIYSDEEKEKLWLQKLDKGERWINGIKIDISKGNEGYNTRLKQEQKKNARLGYGSNMVSWQEEKYMEERRRMIQDDRENKYYGEREVRD